jgi:hypothetical protein
LADIRAPFRGLFWKPGVSLNTVVKPVGETIMSAAAAVSELVKGQALGPQIRQRLERANGRRLALKVEHDACSLDRELGDQGAAEKQKRLRQDLDKADAECVRLQAALQQAVDRDAERETEVDLAALKGQLAKYEEFGAARVQAVIDLTAATTVATEAARRFMAATSLLQDATPAGCELPRGLILGRDMEATIEAVQAETDRVLTHVKSLVSITIAYRRGEEIER